MLCTLLPVQLAKSIEHEILFHSAEFEIPAAPPMLFQFPKATEHEAFSLCGIRNSCRSPEVRWKVKCRCCRPDLRYDGAGIRPKPDSGTCRSEGLGVEWEETLRLLILYSLSPTSLILSADEEEFT
jgi:hypothetical protein